MKKLALLATLLCNLAGIVVAQNIQDVIFLNPSVQNGTPRFAATAGAFTALGNDFSGIHLNPAGLAVYRHNEFGFSMGFANRSVRSSYYGSTQYKNYNGVYLSSLGYVANLKSDDPKSFWTFGITYNQNSDFSSETQVQGTNPESTIIENWMNNAEGIAPNDLLNYGMIYEYLGYLAVLYSADANNSYSTTAELGTTNQFISERTRGSLNELGISLAKNESDELYYGFSLNIPFYKYNVDYYYEESGYGGTDIKGME